MISKAPVFQRTKPAHSPLLSYIDNYVLFSHNEGKLLHKNMLPCPGVSLLFNFSDIRINGAACPITTIIGLHDTVYKLEGSTDSIETLIVQFSPWGCSQLIPMSVSRLTNTILDAEEVFGNSLTTLYTSLKNTPDYEGRVQLLDQYFQSRIKLPDAGYIAIAEIAAQLRQNPEPVSFSTIHKSRALPLSMRQMARRFKDIIGLNLQAYIRICRFGLAKSLLFENQELSMTDVGYHAGYYDQAHFSKEFKKLSGANAKDFIPLCAFQKMQQ